jgi:hypothetical protein
MGKDKKMWEMEQEAASGTPCCSLCAVRYSLIIHTIKESNDSKKY